MVWVNNIYWLWTVDSTDAKSIQSENKTLSFTCYGRQIYMIMTNQLIDYIVSI